LIKSISISALDDVQQHGFRFLGALQDRVHELDEARVLWLLESTQQAILHDSHKLAVAQLPVHVLVKDRKDDVNDVIREIHEGDCLRNMLERELVNAGASNVVELQGDIDVIDVVEKVEEVQVIFLCDSSAVISEPKTDN